MHDHVCGGCFQLALHGLLLFQRLTRSLHIYAALASNTTSYILGPHWTLQPRSLPITSMSLQHRPTTGDAGYEPISQEEVGINESETPVLHLEEDEALAEEFITQEHAAEHDRRIYWIHVVLGCAILLPWNGELNLVFSTRTNLIASSLCTSESFDYCNSLLPLKAGRVLAQRHFQLLPVDHVHCGELWLPRTRDKHFESGLLYTASY